MSGSYDPDLVPVKSGTVFTEGMMPGAVPVNFVSRGAPLSAAAVGAVVPPASELSVMRTQMVSQQPPSQVLAPPNGAASAQDSAAEADAAESGPSMSWLPLAGLALAAFLAMRKRR